VHAVTALKTDNELRGAAFHEAGHVIVARELGLLVGEIAIGIDGDDAKGRSDVGSAHHLPLIDQVALCVAGIVAQSLFNWPTHNFAGAGDYARVIELVEGMTDANSLKLRNAAYARAREILERRATEVERLAKQLLKHRRIT
jgi:hypothetical protein